MAIVQEGHQRAGLQTYQQYALAVAYCIMSLVFGIQLSICGPTASLLAAQTGGTEADLAPVLGCGGIGMIIGGLPSGWITDRFPGHHVLAVSHFVQAVGFLLIPLCRSVLQLAIVYGTISLTFTMTNTALNCMAIWLLTPAPGQPEPPMTVAFLLNTISAMFGVGALAAPQIVLLMNKYTGSGINIFYVAVAMSTLIIIAFSMLPSSPRAPPPADDTPTPSTPGSYAHSTASHPRSPRRLPPTAVGMPQPVLSRQNSVDHHAHPSAAPSRNTSCTVRRGGASKSAGSSVHGDSLAHAVVAGLRKAGDLDAEAAAHWGVHAQGEHERAARQKKWKVPFLAAALMLVFANISIELGFGNWIFTYCIREADLSEDAGQQITSLFWLAFTLGRVPAMIMVAYVSVSTIMAITMPLAIIGALVPLVFDKSMPGSGGLHPPAPPSLLMGAEGMAAAGDVAAVATLADDGRQLTTLFVVISTILVACGSAAGTPCTLSLATEYITVDGFINGLIGTVAGIGATTFPYVVPVLAKAIPSLGFQCLMAATLVMAFLQLGSLFAMLSFGKAMGKMADFEDVDDLDGHYHHHEHHGGHHHHHHLESHGDGHPGHDIVRISEKPSELEEPLLHDSGTS